MESNGSRARGIEKIVFWCGVLCQVGVVCVRLCWYWFWWTYIGRCSRGFIVYRFLLLLVNWLWAIAWLRYRNGRNEKNDRKSRIYLWRPQMTFPLTSRIFLLFFSDALNPGPSPKWRSKYEWVCKCVWRAVACHKSKRERRQKCPKMAGWIHQQRQTSSSDAVAFMCGVCLHIAAEPFWIANLS